MGLNVFNTLSRSIEPFVPLDPEGKKVGLYCCGPTVHDFAHIGNFRTFVFTDVVRRYLTFRGFDVRHVMNITDVEDKIIRRVNESGKSLSEYTGEFEKAFFNDLEALGCLMPDERPHATKFIGPIIKLIKKLEDNGIAYRAGDGSVYFSIEKYREAGNRYGQLLNLNLKEMRPGERVSSDEYEKESVADFALWKARVPEDGEVFWKSPWGEGRPGWHIECSAMSMELLGPSFDLHLGGEDLVFPHHEDEIAQSEGACVQCDGQKFVKYWMHGAHLLVEGKKMSKSLGNFFTLRDLLAKGSAGREVRYLMISAHYRETFNFTLDNLAGPGPRWAASTNARPSCANLRLAKRLQRLPTHRSSPASLRRWTTTSTSPPHGQQHSTGCATPTANSPPRNWTPLRPPPSWPTGNRLTPCLASRPSKRKRRPRFSPWPRNARQPARRKTSRGRTRSATNSPPKVGSSKTPPMGQGSSEFSQAHSKRGSPLLVV